MRYDVISGNSRKEKYRNTAITKCFKQVNEILEFRHVLQDRYDNCDIRGTDLEKINEEQYNLYHKFLCILDSLIHNSAEQKAPILFARINNPAASSGVYCSLKVLQSGFYTLHTPQGAGY